MEHLSKIDQHVITDNNQWSYDLIKFSVQKGQYTPIRPLWIIMSNSCTTMLHKQTNPFVYKYFSDDLSNCAALR